MNHPSVLRPNPLIAALLAAAAFAATAPATAAGAAEPTLEPRAECMRRIDEIYWRHRSWPAANPGPRPAFEDAVPPAVHLAAAEDALLASRLLDERWGEPITASGLQAELDRMAAATRRPELLRELFDALGRDPRRIAECLVRPRLAERRARELYGADPELHDDLRRRAEAELAAAAGPRALGAAAVALGVDYREDSWQSGDAAAAPGAERSRLEAALSRAFGAAAEAVPVDRFSPLAEDAGRFYSLAVVGRSGDGIEVASAVWPKRPFEEWWREERARLDLAAAGTGGFDFRLPEIAAGAASAGPGSWSSTAAMPLDVEGEAVWTGAEMLIWGRHSTQGYRYDPATDLWTPMTVAGAPQNRREYSAVWTGTEMLVWGGCSAQNHRCTLATGGAYDPVADAWRDLPTAPISRTRHSAVWTGDEMVVWGGCNYFNDNCSIHSEIGAVLDPATGSWRLTAAAGAPPGRDEPGMVWTGSEVMVWSGAGLGGGRWDPASDSWSPVSAQGAPPGDLGALVWTGSEAVAWGGCTGSPQCATPSAEGGRYDPAIDTWAPTSAAGAPSARWWPGAVWTGEEVVLWGGTQGLGGGGAQQYLGDGARYDPATDTWAPIAAGAPSGRARQRMLWTGAEALVWGGVNGVGFGVDVETRSGGRYDPAVDAWAPIRDEDPMTLRARHTAVWTGAEMIVWGGDESGIRTDTGRAYDPATDAWRDLPGAGAPSARRDHTAVWSGTEMIVWGGPVTADGVPGDGGRYDPATDAWSPVVTAGAPTERADHTAVWTGTEMIVWGGSGWSTPWMAGGASYDPAADDWTPVGAGGEPAGRSEHLGFWTGDRMLLWGGRDAFGPLASGGLYDPATGAWTPVSAAGAPPAAWNPVAVWTGSEMIVWGGAPTLSSPTAEGGRYRPATDTWSATALTGAPSARRDHTAVWTGAEMLVWGGCGDSSCFTGDGEGGRYDPAADAWQPIPAPGVLEPRTGHTAVWTGDEMIAWGGIADRNGFSHLGGRYRPEGGAPPTAIFADGFESGDTTTWTSSTP